MTKRIIMAHYDKNEILDMLIKQIENIYFKRDTDVELLEKYYDLVMDRTLYCFNNNKNKYYLSCAKEGINILHSCQWLIFLYYYANTIYNKEVQLRKSIGGGGKRTV